MAKKTEFQEELRRTGEKLWDATCKTLNTATFHANLYKRVVQKQLDLKAIQKKISVLHRELGKLIDEGHATGRSDLLEGSEVQAIFHRLAGLKRAAATLEEEIEAIRAETPPPPDGSAPPRPD